MNHLDANVTGDGIPVEGAKVEQRGLGMRRKAEAEGNQGREVSNRDVMGAS